MTDILFPPDLIPNASNFSIDDFTALDESATTGTMQSSALYGTRRWHLRMDFNSLSRKSGTLARFEAFIASMRGRQNRVWISPPQQVNRGSLPAPELLTNNNFANGSSGWTSDAQYSLSSLVYGARASRVQATAGSDAAVQSVSRSLQTAYAMRGFIMAGRGNSSMRMADFVDSIVIGVGQAQGMIEGSYFPVTAGAANVGFYDPNTTNALAGNFFDARWASFARCAVVDYGSNLLLNSDTFSSWGLGSCTLGTPGISGPDGSLVAISLTETAVTNVHYFNKAVTVAAGAANYTFSCYVLAGTRTWCFLQMTEATGGTSVLVYYNMSTGAVGTNSVGAAFTLLSTNVVDCGGGWKRVILTVRKINAAVSMTCYVGAASANGTNSYLGVVGTPAMYMWRGSLAISAVPVVASATAGVATVGAAPSGYTMNLKALPASTQGILLEGDLVECDMPNYSQLLRVTSRLDSDAAGLGTLIFENALKQTPVDEAAVIVQSPMGRFALAVATLGIEYAPGVFGSSSLEFIESA